MYPTKEIEKSFTEIEIEKRFRDSRWTNADTSYCRNRK
jgi:hypothetical protein